MKTKNLFSSLMKHIYCDTFGDSKVMKTMQSELPVHISIRNWVKMRFFLKSNQPPLIGQIPSKEKDNTILLQEKPISWAWKQRAFYVRMDNCTIFN